MPKNKKQHYVNKSHLRMFAVTAGKAHIGTYIKKTNKIIAEADLNNQAYEDYFYGKDSHVEKMLAKLESQAGKVIEQFENNTVISFDTEEYGYFLCYIFTLTTRTLKAVNDHERLLDEYFKKYIKGLLGFTELQYIQFCNDYELRSDEPAKDYMNFMLTSAVQIFDLKLKILVNKTPKCFITSDHPVVRYNQFLENYNSPSGNAGFQTPGLQMFLPISPTRAIMLYDSKVYNVGKKNSDIVVIKEQNDVDQLNVLQFLNANNQIYFNGHIKEEYIRLIEKKSKRVKSLGGYSVITENGCCVGIEQKCLSIDLGLSFCFEVDKAKMLRDQGKVPLIRDLELVNYSQYYSRITKGRLPHPRIKYK